MPLDNRSRLSRYGIAIASVGLALLLASLLSRRADPSHFTLFFGAVMVTAWYGGLEAGLLATILSALSLDYFFISRDYSLVLTWSALLRLGVFVLVASLTSSLTAARKRAEEALRIAHSELEKRVQERTAELADANVSLREEIVERRRAEKELWLLQREMGRVERLAALGRITGNIAHELGTPLNSVLGYTQLLAQEDLSEGARRRLTIIETQVQRMGEIIQHYLSNTRGTRRSSAINPNELVGETLVLFSPMFQQHELQVTTHLADSLPLIRGDGASLQRVLTNVLDNAVDASQKGGLLTISTSARPSFNGKGPGVVIEVEDKGVGIPAELLPRIFDLFVTTKPSGKGTGLGLVVCQEIVKTHGGAIDIQSQIGIGTTVQIFLPTDQKLPQAV